MHSSCAILTLSQHGMLTRNVIMLESDKALSYMLSLHVDKQCHHYMMSVLVDMQ